jgi:hypothetical protein
MHTKDTPDRVSVQLNMSVAERQALKAIAAADGTSMTQWLLRQIAVAAKEQGIPLPEASQPPTAPKLPRTPFRSMALVVSSDGEEQWRAFIAAMIAIRGREETEQEWQRIHALYWGVKGFVAVSSLYRAAKTWRASGYQRRLTERLQAKLEALLEFEPLKKKWFAAWSKRTGYGARKAKERRLRNLDAARKQEAARQAKCQGKKRLEKAEHIAAFELEHVTGPDYDMEAVFDAAAE